MDYTWICKRTKTSAKMDQERIEIGFEYKGNARTRNVTVKVRCTFPLRSRNGSDFTPHITGIV